MQQFLCRGSQKTASRTWTSFSMNRTCWWVFNPRSLVCRLFNNDFHFQEATAHGPLEIAENGSYKEQRKYHHPTLNVRLGTGCGVDNRATFHPTVSGTAFASGTDRRTDPGSGVDRPIFLTDLKIMATSKFHIRTSRTSKQNLLIHNFIS